MLTKIGDKKRWFGTVSTAMKVGQTLVFFSPTKKTLSWGLKQASYSKFEQTKA